MDARQPPVSPSGPGKGVLSIVPLRVSTTSSLQQGEPLLLGTTTRRASCPEKGFRGELNTLMATLTRTVLPGSWLDSGEEQSQAPDVLRARGAESDLGGTCSVKRICFPYKRGVRLTARRRCRASGSTLRLRSGAEQPVRLRTWWQHPGRTRPARWWGEGSVGRGERSHAVSEPWRI